MTLIAESSERTNLLDNFRANHRKLIMLPNNFSELLPYLQPELKALETYQFTQEFYKEVQERKEFEAYCQWYYDTAESHRQELQKMQGDLNLFGWFRRQK